MGLVLVDQTPSAVPPDLLLSLLEILEWMPVTRALM